MGSGAWPTVRPPATRPPRPSFPRRMSNQNVELVRSIHPTDVDLVEFFGQDLAAFMDWGPPDSFADAFGVQFISDSGELEYQGLEGFIEGWRDWLEPWSTYRMKVE